ncbi:sulfotransferase family protein [Marinilabilia rubra]|uniref:Sulfotransferase n=1 Tax=Marinilabilia rubra TaxID=2162893 RepID=A0A2U2B3W8_9BACT|nr:hypothetical protein [Marinilabilia rubra]PWD97762.1 hypothetical protein DDZ16_19190 [Marinilabilia rubra]
MKALKKKIETFGIKILNEKKYNALVSNIIDFNKQFIPYIKALKCLGATHQKFLIFGQGRSGSTLLVSLLNSHPNIKCEGEILNNATNFRKGNILFPKLFLRGKLAMYGNKFSYGYKVKVYQLEEQKKIHNISQFLNKQQNNGWKIIFLQRKNVFDHAMSNIMAETTKRYHSYNNLNDYQAPKIKVNINDLDEKIHFRHHYHKLENEILANLKGDYITVTYEDDLLIPEKHQKTASKIFNYLNLEDADVATHLKKINSKKWDELIENYQEVKIHMAASYNIDINKK